MCSQNFKSGIAKPRSEVYILGTNTTHFGPKCKEKNLNSGTFSEGKRGTFQNPFAGQNSKRFCDYICLGAEMYTGEQTGFTRF